MREKIIWTGVGKPGVHEHEMVEGRDAKLLTKHISWSGINSEILLIVQRFRQSR